MDWVEAVAVAVLGYLVGMVIEIVLPRKVRYRIESSRRRVAKWMRNESLTLSFNQDYAINQEDPTAAPEVFKVRIKEALTSLSKTRFALGAESQRFNLTEGGTSLAVTVSPTFAEATADDEELALEHAPRPVCTGYTMRMNCQASYRTLYRRLQDVLAALRRFEAGVSQQIPVRLRHGEVVIGIKDDFPMSELLDPTMTTQLLRGTAAPGIEFTYLKGKLKVEASLNSQTIAWIRTAVAIA